MVQPFTEGHPGSAGLTVVTFRDALGLAMLLADEYAFVNAAAVLDRSGAVTALGVVDGVGQSIELLVGWCRARADGSELHGPRPNAGASQASMTRRRPSAGAPSAGAPSAGANVLLVTVRPHDQDVISEYDLALFRRARWSLAEAGLDLSDWIETDGDLFRSYAYVTCPAQAWPEDPPQDRMTDAAR